MKPTTILLIVIVLLGHCALNAQSETGKKIERTGRDMEETTKALKKGGELIKGIFGKRGKKGNKKGESTSPSELENQLPPETVATETPEGDGTSQSMAEGENGPKAGDVHPDAVVLDVDELYPFFEGAALVQKGSSTGLINAKGEFLVPLNTYEFKISESKNGIFPIRRVHGGTGMEWGFVNFTGKYIDLKEFRGKTRDLGIRGDHYVLMDKDDYSTYYYVDVQGSKIKITYQLSDYSGKSIEGFPFADGLVIFRANSKFGYKNSKNQVVIEPIYDEAFTFSNGAAIIGKKNEFGELKYGYIDTKGNQITPIQFSKRPEPFYSGRAKVYYNDIIHKYSFINKRGEIIFTDIDAHFESFYHGYSHSISKKQIMDLEGKIASDKEFLKSYGVQMEMHNETILFPEKNYINSHYGEGVVSFWFDVGKMNTRMNGILFLDKGTAFYGTFSERAFKYDPISGLTLTTFKKSSKFDDITKGYVNHDGVFMIVKGEASKW